MTEIVPGPAPGNDSDASLMEDNPIYKSVDEVHFIPPAMVFSNAYEGKDFEYTLIIQNFGKKVAFIKMCPPTSRAFRLKTITQGRYLAPGLKIERKVTYTFTTPIAVPYAFMPICINNTWINYKFFVTLSSPVITIDPPQLDFGRVDADHTAAMRTLTIRNDGHKGTNFAIDLGRNPLEIIVDPMKGTIAAKSKLILRVEISGFTEGNFAEEIWIKTVPPLMVIVTGNFISPKLMVRDFQSTLQISLMDFPKTYYGARCTKPLVIHNYSSSNSIFCVMAEIRGSTVSLEQARETIDDYRNIILQPYDGRTYADKGSVVQITFAPLFPHKKNHRKFICCFLKIIRMNCHDITPGVFVDSMTIPTERAIRESVIMLQPSISQKTDFHDTASLSDDDDITDNSFTRVCLHGEMEYAKITIRPDLLVLNDLDLMKTYERELFIENQSPNLSIIVKYVKIASIDITPSQFELKPKGTIEIKLTVRTSKLGMIDMCVHFDLLCADLPKDEMVLRKVGSDSIKIQISTHNVIKGGKMKKCCLVDADLITKLDYEQIYKLRDDEFVKKYQNRVYYRNFLRKHRDKIKIDRDLEDYDLANSKLLKAENVKIGDCMKKEIVKEFSWFIPLVPRQLYKIKISPRYFKLRNAAAYTTITEYLTVENRNDFPVRLFFKPSKLCLSFPNDARVVIPGGEKYKIPFIFSSYSNGKYNVTIEVIVNESHVFTIATLAQVVPKTIKVPIDVIDFNENDGEFKFIKLENPINSDVNFEWELPAMSCFDVYPLKGTVPPGRSLFCMITYHPDPTQPDSIECSVQSESGAKTSVQISHCKTTTNVAFVTPHLNVGSIPLNKEIIKIAILKNLASDPVSFNLAENCPLEGIEVLPKNGLIGGRSIQIFTVRILIKSVIKFQTEISVEVQEKTSISLMIEGEIEFPLISVTPEFMKFRQIYINSYGLMAFQIVNESKCEVTITFVMEDYPEFTISSYEHHHLPHIHELVLDPSDVMILFLHCRPLNVSTYTMYLPLVLNGIIGPSLINDSQTINAKYFLTEHDCVYHGSMGVEFKKIDSPALSLNKINCYATDKAVIFSNLYFHLRFYARDHYNNKTVENFEITNVTEEIIEMCIRTDDLVEPFDLFPSDVDDFQIYDLSYVFQIAPESKAKFRVFFEPTTPGEYFLKMPIFIKGHDAHRIFNYLKIVGLYQSPSIVPRKKTIFLEPVPRKVTSTYNLVLDISDHLDGCTISSTTENTNVNAIFPDGRANKKRNGQIPVTINSSSHTIDHTIDNRLKLSCSCGGSCEIFVKGVVENCILTCHEIMNSIDDFELFKKPLKEDEAADYLSVRTEASSTMMLDSFRTIENSNKNKFPFFPKNDDTSEYAEHLRSVVETLENWIYSQGFFFQRFLKIPEDFYEIPSAEIEKQSRMFHKKTSLKSRDPRLVELIVNLTGSSVRKKLVTTQLVKDNVDDSEVMIFLYTTNLNVIKFLTNHEAYFPHVMPENLLRFDQYVMYKKITNEPVDMTREEFYRLSKQCWVDMLIQVIKVLVLFRLNTSKYDTMPSLMMVDKSKINYFENPSGNDDQLSRKNDFYHRSEGLILEWMNDRFDKEKLKLWPSAVPTSMIVTSFDEDLKSGIVFGAITASYCPYANNFLKDMFVDPRNDAEIFHNSCCLIQTWRLLGLSYAISPKRLSKPINLEMLLIAIYLFDVLPNFVPKDIVTIESPLTRKTKAEISLINCGEVPIIYKTNVFHNDDGCFIIEQDTIKVAARETVKVCIMYFAKRILKISSVLIFNGETPGQKFGTTITFHLLGIPDVTCLSADVALKLTMYQPREVKIEVESPYKVEASYQAYVAYRPPGSMTDLRPLTDLFSSKLPGMFMFKSQLRASGKDGKFRTYPYINSIVQGDYTAYVYYTNKEIGDFGLRLNFVGVPSKKHYETIEVDLGKDFHSGKCSCQGNMFHVYCPKLVKIPIPCINNLWAKARRIMVLANLTASELEFWKELLASPAGLRILNLLQESELDDATAFLGAWQTNYNVILDPNCPFIAEKAIDIVDSTAEETVPLLIHASSDLVGVKSFVKLESGCGKEVRLYKVLFK